MKSQRFVLLVLGFLSSPCFALAQAAQELENSPLIKIERKIAKEPVYKKTPKYCLVVFGEEAARRVWLVVDGDTLYADLNGNGDLTEKAEQFKEGKDLYRYTWELGDIIEMQTKSKHTGFAVHNINNDFYRIGVHAGYDRAGCRLVGSAQLKFGSKPANAPIVHFGGPLVMGMSIATIADEPGFICARMGTPGVGGEDTFVDYTLSIMMGIGAKAWPDIELEYKEKDKVIREKAGFFKDSFDKAYLYPVIPGKKEDKRQVRITLSFPALRAINVAPTTFTRPILTLKK